MTTPPMQAYGKIPEPRLRSLEAIAGSQRGMDEVVRWAAAQTPPQRIVDVVIQDEFSHDFVLRLSDDLYAVYEAT